MSDDRFDRQSRLPEIGEAGQARLRAARISVRGADASAIERLYLSRAGVERIDWDAEREPEVFVHASLFASDSARAVAAAAWRALSAIRRELGIVQ